MVILVPEKHYEENLKKNVLFIGVDCEERAREPRTHNERSYIRPELCRGKMCD